MSKGKGKMRAAPAPKKKKVTGAERKARRNVAKNSVIIFWLTAIVLVGLFVGKWVSAISTGYFGSFVQVDASAVQAVGNMKGLNPSAEEKETLLPLQKQWDLFTAARLRDEVTAEAYDGAQLHGYLYDEGSDVTVIVLPRFHQDGTADFLPGVSLHELTGCNILLPDPRMHGGSAGEYFTYGIREQNDVRTWIDWADENLGPQTFIIWGEGTGANTALFAAANGLLPDSVAFIAAESPYASLHELAHESIWKWYSVPAFPFLNAIEGRVARSHAGFTVADVDLPAALEGKAPVVPVLFLVSAYDSFIRPAWSEAVSAAYGGPQQTVTGGGTHGTVYAACQSEIDAAAAALWTAYTG